MKSLLRFSNGARSASPGKAVRFVDENATVTVPPESPRLALLALLTTNTLAPTMPVLAFDSFVERALACAPAAAAPAWELRLARCVFDAGAHACARPQSSAARIAARLSQSACASGFQVRVKNGVPRVRLPALALAPCTCGRTAHSAVQRFTDVFGSADLDTCPPPLLGDLQALVKVLERVQARDNRMQHNASELSTMNRSIMRSLNTLWTHCETRFPALVVSMLAFLQASPPTLSLSAAAAAAAAAATTTRSTDDEDAFSPLPVALLRALDASPKTPIKSVRFCTGVNGSVVITDANEVADIHAADADETAAMLATDEPLRVMIIDAPPPPPPYTSVDFDLDIDSGREYSESRDQGGDDAMACNNGDTDGDESESARASGDTVPAAPPPMARRPRTRRSRARVITFAALAAAITLPQLRSAVEMCGDEDKVDECAFDSASPRDSESESVSVSEWEMSRAHRSDACECKHDYPIAHDATFGRSFLEAFVGAHSYLKQHWQQQQQQQRVRETRPDGAHTAADAVAAIFQLDALMIFGADGARL